MGTPTTKRNRPSRAGQFAPLSDSQLRLLRIAQKEPVLKADAFGYIPSPTLPVKGAAAHSIVKSLQLRGLVNDAGSITLAGLTTLGEIDRTSAGEC